MILLFADHLLNNNKVNSHHFIFTGTGEGESNDRDTLELPGHQADLLRDSATYSKSVMKLMNQKLFGHEA